MPGASRVSCRTGGTGSNSLPPDLARFKIFFQSTFRHPQPPTSIEDDGDDDEIGLPSPGAVDIFLPCNTRQCLFLESSILWYSRFCQIFPRRSKDSLFLPENKSESDASPHVRPWRCSSRQYGYAPRCSLSVSCHGQQREESRDRE